MLLAFIAFETVVRNRTVITDSTTITDTLFYNCSSEEHGGAIYCGNIGINVFVEKSSFVRCYSGKYGGAIGIGSANFTSLDSVSGRQCSVFFNDAYPYGSFGIFWTHSKVEKISVSECAPNIKASIGVHFESGRQYLCCCNLTENWNEYGYASLVYFNLCQDMKILSSVFMNNSSPILIKGESPVNYTVFINNKCSSIGSGNFYCCCFYGNSVSSPSSATLCVSDKIVYMTDYSVCEFSDMTKEFTAKRELKLNLLVLFLVFGLV